MIDVYAAAGSLADDPVSASAHRETNRKVQLHYFVRPPNEES
jgi:hypothetical protein